MFRQNHNHSTDYNKQAKQVYKKLSLHGWNQKTFGYQEGGI